MATKKKIRPIYAELQEYMLHAPMQTSDSKNTQLMFDPNVWNLFNHTVDTLMTVTGDDYDRFKVKELYYREPGETKSHECVDVTQYRMKLGGLINRLHAEYFSDDTPPFASNPSMVINQTQQQGQAVCIKMLVDITEQLTRSEANFEEGSKERGFIGKVKDRLKSAVTGTTSVAQLVALLLHIARECGLSIEDVQKVFGG